MEKYPLGIYGNFYMAYVLYGFMKIILTLLNRQWYYDLLEAIFTFRRCVLNGLEVACYKICNLLLHKLAKVCTSDVCKLYGYTCVCVVYVGCVFVWHGCFTLYITCMYTTSHVCIYVCVLCGTFISVSFPLHYLYFQTQIRYLVRQEEENHIYQTHDQSFSLRKGLWIFTVIVSTSL